VDFPTKEELLASNRTLEQIADFREVDSIGYQSLEGLLSCAKYPAEHYCTACWTDRYPIPVDIPVSKFAMEPYQMRMFDDYSLIDE
jgi:amidophosphoribosyltransferase